MLLGIFARGLAERFARFLDVQNVVHDLKRQADVLAVARNGIELLFVGARVDRPHAHAGPQQRAGLGAMDGFEQLGVGRLSFALEIRHLPADHAAHRSRRRGQLRNHARLAIAGTRPSSRAFQTPASAARRR